MTITYYVYVDNTMTIVVSLVAVSVAFITILILVQFLR